MCNVVIPAFDSIHRLNILTSDPLIVEEPGIKNVKNKHLGMPLF